MSTAGPARVRVFHDGIDGVADLHSGVAAAWPDAQLCGCGTGGDFAAALVWSAEPAELVDFAARQTGRWWLHTTASGLPEQVVAALRGRDVVVTNGAGAHGAAVAEHVTALLLAHYKRLATLRDAQRERAWRPPAGVEELRHKTVGILGLGDLGRSTARVLAALGAVVLGLRRGPGDVPDVARTYRTPDLARFLPRLDALVIAAPLTAETRGLIGAKELAALPRGAFVVNVGRGPILDEGALAAAVGAGHLAGAALDVFADEPLPTSSPLWSLPDVTITPHCADSTAATARRCLDLLLDNVHRYTSGRALRNVVDLARGY